MKPKGAVASHENHAVNEASDEEGPSEVLSKEIVKRNDEGKCGKPTKEGKPVLSIAKNIHAFCKFAKKFAGAWAIESIVFYEPIARCIEHSG